VTPQTIRRDINQLCDDALLQRYHRRGATVVIATHDHETIRRTPGRVIQLERGRLMSQPAADDP
jgi:ABC-type ATPase involved in cell division